MANLVDTRIPFLPLLLVIGATFAGVLWYLGFMNLLRSLLFWGIVGGGVYLFLTRYEVKVTRR